MARVFGSFDVAIRAVEAPDEELAFEFPTGTKNFFTIAQNISAAPLMKFAAALEIHTKVRQISFMAAMDGLIKDCLKDQAEYERFMATAAKYKATSDDIWLICRGIWEELNTDHPTQRPSDSSDGQPPTSENSNSKPSRAGRRSSVKGRKAATVTRMQPLPAEDTG